MYFFKGTVNRRVAKAFTKFVQDFLLVPRQLAIFQEFADEIEKAQF